MSDNGPTFTKATFDAKRPKYTPPSPDRIAAAEKLLGIECARNRDFDKRIKAVGLAEVMGITPPKQSFERRI